MDYRVFLENNEYLSDLPAEELNQLESHCTLKTLNKGGRLFEIGQNGNKLYILISGELKLWFKGGREVILRKGDCFGEIALITDHGRQGTIRAVKNSKLIAIEKQALIGNAVISFESSLGIVQKMANNSARYLLQNFSLNAKTLAEKGEGENIEYKESFPSDKVAKDKIFKTINAFLNTSGGTILLGVDDDGRVVGIKNWSNSLGEKIICEINNRVKMFGADVLDYVNSNSEEIKNKVVIRIDVQYINRAVFMPNKTEDYYIRKNASIHKLNKSDTYKHLKNRGL
jgi:CRP-like cAMP-binding protein